ncbi:MAG: EAL domain-containing protein, partial [Sedimenticola sp.]|nr:EAL domain-containing protein [Sedimenticola sp.]
MGRILVVEDDLLMGQDISLKLQRLGYEVVAVVATSEDAIQTVANAQPDLILMDIILEGAVDGIETAARIKQSYTIPIIYLTAYDDEDFIKRASITEPYGYVLKPYTARELHAVVSISLYKAQAERTLRQAAQISATLASMSDPVLKVDRSGRLQMCNLAAEGFLGRTAEGLLDQPVSSVIKLQWNGRGENVLPGLIDSVFSSGESLEIDQDLVLRNEAAKAVHVSLRISEVPDTADVEGGAVLLLQDISERTAMQEELNLVAQVFKSSTEGILITDLQPRILRVNRAYLDITGYSRKEVIGQNPNILSSGYHDQEFFRQLWQTLLEEGRWSGEVWNRRKNGEIYPELLNITAVKDDKGNTTHYVGIFTDVSSRKLMQEQLNYLTLFDSLTGLANRNLFQDRVALAIDHARSKKRSMALMMVDIDNFNTINEVSGHAYGDQLLAEFSKRLSELVKNEERLARFGGDVFALSAEECDGEVPITELAQTMLDVLSVPFHADGKSVQLTVSIGISVFPGDGEDVFELLKSTDNALHHAKRAGKNSYRFFDKAMYESVLETRRIEQGLRSSIARHELQLHYQPQIEIESGKVRGCEALVRWYPQGLGEVYPAQFIPIAEESGQIIAIGKWILHEACDQFVRWESQGCAPHHVAVNVSARQFRDPDFVTVVRDIIEETGMRPDTLMLEITESVAMEQGETAINKLTELKDLGVKLSLDDFGTGFSALSSLQRYPFDTLKIDRSFIVQSQSSGQGAVMLE